MTDQLDGTTPSDQLLQCSHCGKPGSSVFAGGRYEPGCDMWHPRCFALAVGGGLEETLGSKFGKAEARGYVAACIDIIGMVPRYSKTGFRYTSFISPHGDIIARLKVALKTLDIPHSISVKPTSPGLKPDLVLTITGGLSTWEALASLPVGDAAEKISENYAGFKDRERQRFLRWKKKGFKGPVPREFK
jgi:hypothetical protein